MALDRSQIIVDLVDVVDVFQEVFNGPVHVEVLELAASQRAGRGNCHEDQASRHTRPSQCAQALSAAPFAPLVRPIVVPRPIQALSPAREMLLNVSEVYAWSRAPPYCPHNRSQSHFLRLGVPGNP